MYKLITLLKRRPGMSLEAFRDYYENHHARIGAALLPGRAKRYVRRYFQPSKHPADGAGAPEQAFDALMEIWFEDEIAYAETMANFSDTELGRFVVEDEGRVFDRSRIRFYVVDEERETLLDPTHKRSREEVEEIFCIYRPL